MASIINASSSGSGGIVQTADASGVLQLQSNGTLALAISGANVAIGGSSPSAWSSSWKALDISTSSSVTSSSSGTDLWQNAYESAGGPLYKTAGYASVVRASSAGGFEVYTAPTGSAGAAVTFTRALQLGPSQTLALAGATSQSGTGITFPATQSASSNSNTLDDYEEGTWTPTLTFGGSSTGMTYGDQIGNYVKVGKWVTITFNIALTAKGSSTGGARVQGMPFLNYTDKQLSSGLLVGERSMSSFNQTNAYFLIWNDGNLYLRYNGATGYIDFNDTFFTNGSCIYGVLTYQTYN